MARDKSDGLGHFFGGVGTDEGAGFSLDESPQAPEESAPDGEIAIDCFETERSVVVVSPLAGVDPEEIEIAASEDSITISGERKAEHTSQSGNLITQEIYWGSFSRTVELPSACDVDKAQAAFKHGVLTVTIPKTGQAKKRVIKVKKAE